MRSFFNRILGISDRPLGPLPIRESGLPPSGNGASSFHLIWQVPHATVIAVRATLEVTQPPRTSDLYFFALQATFTGTGGDQGGAHVGLQWNRRHPGSTAANWGGYRSQQLGGTILSGTESNLPSRPSDPNTRDFPWEPHRAYRLAIEPGYVPGWWLGTVTDLATGESTSIRELDGGGRSLRAPMVWIESFAACDAPTVEARWSDLEVAPRPDQWERVHTIKTNYQSYGAGGCTNTNITADEHHIAQRTNSERTTDNGELLPSHR
ncbi:MAG: hypothetical protein GY720_15625 [bacterium]|nr:hypothetical protein [bacterium]